ncbi:hypothetical protein ACQUW5_00070 [Legionella sp. CNM-1927-20]|uniref:hypothetical protein n=1 Tax=Legionella sp. CNM-1927-20 TaxID=3422221 RepID=UPI00403AA650
MKAKITFDELLNAAKKCGDILEMGVKLKVSPKRLYGIFCLLGRDRNGLTELNAASETAMRQRFLDNDLSDYLLKKEDLNLLNEEDAKKLLNFNVNVLGGMFSTTTELIREELRKRGLNPADIQRKYVQAQGYIKAKEFIEYVKGLRKTSQLVWMLCNKANHQYPPPAQRTRIQLYLKSM